MSRGSYGKEEDIGAVRMLRVEAKDLKRSYYRLMGEIKDTIVDNPYDRNRNPHHLLFIYAIECGLKYVWLREKNLHISPIKEDYEIFYSHDLSMLFSQLKTMASDSIEISEILKSQVTITQNISNQRVHLSKIHEAWRYGVNVMPDDEEKTIVGLKKISTWIEKLGYL